MLPIIAGFTDYLTNERHFSHYTARCYGADLRQYVEFLAGEANLEVVDANEKVAYQRTLEGGSTEVAATIVPNTVTKLICNATPDTIREFLSDLGTKDYSAATMARKIATLRSFYKWADRRGFAEMPAW